VYLNNNVYARVFIIFMKSFYKHFIPPTMLFFTYIASTSYQQDNEYVL